MRVGASRRYGLFLDIQATQSSEHRERGIARYVAQHARALLARGPVRCLALNPSLPFPADLEEDLRLSEVLGWNTAAAVTMATRQGPLAYHIMSPFELKPPVESVLPPNVVRSRIPLIVTLYDLIPLIMSDTYLQDAALRRRYLARIELIRQADLVLAISEHTRRDAVALLGLDEERVVVVGAGVAPYFRPAIKEREPQALIAREFPGITKPFVLAVLGADGRKNSENLLTAYSLLPADLRAALKLVIVSKLPTPYRKLLVEHARRQSIQDHELVLTGWIPDGLLCALYQSADLLVLPSLYEGFGLPAAEAIACGCPTITSNTSALPEILDWPPSCFDPRKPTSIAALIERALTDHRFRTHLIQVAHENASRHSWNAVADKTISALERLPEPEPAFLRRAKGQSRLRLALVGPLPPTRSGIAYYNAKLASELRTLCDLDLFVATVEERTELRRSGGVRGFPVHALGRTLNPGSYDAVIYTFGNSEHHFETYEMALRYPGVIWLHDVRLAGFYLLYARDRIAADAQFQFMAEKLERTYPSARSAEVLREWESPESYATRDIGLTAELAHTALAIIVNSSHARQLLEEDLRDSIDPPPIFVIPPAVPTRAGADAEARDSLLVASFGIVDPIKAPHLLIDAVAEVRKQRPCRLVFVGPVDETLERQLQSHAAGVGLAGKVEFTGEVSPGSYSSWLALAGCAVQIRVTSYGESSAAVLDCLGAGVPVVTNVESSRELPSGVVSFVEGPIAHANLTKAISRLLADPEARKLQAHRGLKYARQRSFSRVARDIENIISDLSRVRLQATVRRESEVIRRAQAQRTAQTTKTSID